MSLEEFRDFEDRDMPRGGKKGKAIQEEIYKAHIKLLKKEPGAVIYLHLK